MPAVQILKGALIHYPLEAMSEARLRGCLAEHGGVGAGG
jgi:hypothetical protein